ncbi:MAG: hypothetical protein JW862_17105 [Anaerolineales bacterium]|nr:hypothetical protein [Anaerolineales bacterium]
MKFPRLFFATLAAALLFILACLPGETRSAPAELAWYDVSPRQLGSSHLWDVWGSDANNLYAVGGSNTLLHRQNGSWLVENPELDNWPTIEYQAVYGLNANDVYVVGHGQNDQNYYKPLILHQDGSGWQAETFDPGGTHAYLRSVWASAADDVYAVGSGSDLLILHLTGGNWTDESFKIPDTKVTLWDVCGVAADDIYAVGSAMYQSGSNFQPVILHKDTDWNVVALPQVAELNNVRLFSIWCGGMDNIYAVGRGGPDMTPSGVIFHKDALGWSYEIIPVSSLSENGLEYRAFYPSAVWGSGSDDVYVVGFGETTTGSRRYLILHNSGSGWVDESLDVAGVTYEDLLGVWGSDPDNVYAVGEGRDPDRRYFPLVLRKYDAPPPTILMLPLVIR